VAATLAGCQSLVDGGDGDGSDGDGSGGDGGEDSGGDGSGGGGSDGDSEGDDTDSEGDDGGATAQVTYARGSSSATLDPQASTSLEDSKVMNQLYETPIVLDPGTATITSNLATEWSLSESGISVTLREDVTFHNGEEFTAEDVVATYRRHLDPEYEHYPGEEYLSSRGQQELGAVETVTVDGEYEVTFELGAPFAPILSGFLSYSQSILPVETIETKGKDLSTEPVGTGPFKLKSWDQGNKRIRLEAHEDYWGEGPKVDEVLFRVIPQNTTRAQALDAGDVDIVDGMSPQAIEIIESSGSASVQSNEGINVGFMAMNPSGFEAFRNKKVRQALNYATDMGAILNTIFRGTSVRSTQPIPPGILGHNDELDPYPYDPEQARQLLAEAGYGDGFEFELVTMTNPRTYNPAPEQAAQIIKSNLTDVGIEVSINKMSFGPYVEFILEGKHQACFLGFSARPDANFFAHKLLHPQVDVDRVPDGQDWVAYDEGYNAFGMTAWVNREYMNLVDDAQRELDRARRDELYRESMALVYDEAPWVFMNHADIIRGVHDRVSDWIPDKQVLGPYLAHVEV